MKSLGITTSRDINLRACWIAGACAVVLLFAGSVHSRVDKAGSATALTASCATLKNVLENNPFASAGNGLDKPASVARSCFCI